MTDRDRDMQSDLRTQAETLRHTGLPGSVARNERYYRILSQVYLGLLIFVVAAGLPIIGIPSLRHRLQVRMGVLQDALLSKRVAAPPVLAKIGENTEPFPKEYEIPLRTWTEMFGAGQFGTPVFRAGARAEAGLQTEVETQGGEDESQRAAEDDATVTFRQGSTEREAYDLVLKNSESMAAMVQGKDPSLRFVTWAAARRDEDTYWVDVKFVRNPEGTEAQYVWQVNLATGKVTPLSALARSLAKP